MIDNNSRADRGQKILDFYAELIGAPDGGEENTASIIADLLHALHRENCNDPVLKLDNPPYSGHDLERAVRFGMGHFLMEQRVDDYVTIDVTMPKKFAVRGADDWEEGL